MVGFGNDSTILNSPWEPRDVTRSIEKKLGRLWFGTSIEIKEPNMEPGSCFLFPVTQRVTSRDWSGEDWSLDVFVAFSKLLRSTKFEFSEFLLGDSRTWKIKRCRINRSRVLKVSLRHGLKFVRTTLANASQRSALGFQWESRHLWHLVNQSEDGLCIYQSKQIPGSKFPTYFSRHRYLESHPMKAMKA